MLLGFGYLYEIVMFFFFFFFQKAENNRLKKMAVCQNFILFLCFCLK